MALVLGVDRFMSEARAGEYGRQCGGLRGAGALAGRSGQDRAARVLAGEEGYATPGGIVAEH
jgi:hypothetical protein